MPRKAKGPARGNTKAVKIIVVKPPRRGIYTFNGMPTMPAPLWNKRVRPK
jgi:hypothetical protein